MISMRKLPASMIKSLIRHGDAKIDSAGLSIKITNTIAPIAVDSIPPNIYELIEIRLEDKLLDLDKLTLTMKDEVYPFKKLHELLQKAFCLGDSVTLKYPDKIISAGSHTIDFRINIPDPIEITADIEFVAK